MSAVTVIWSMLASACLTLAAIHLIVWFKTRGAWADLAFSLTAVATAFMAGGELWMMGSKTAGQLSTAIRWSHVPIWAVFISLIFFARLHLRTGRSWLGWAAGLLRTLALFINFLVRPNINFREVAGLRQVSFLGGSVSVATGVRNPLMLISQLSTLLLAIYVADAALSAWRRGDRRAAVTAGGGIVFFVLAALVDSALALWGILPMPVTNSVFFVGILAAMAYEMTRDKLLAGQLSDFLRESEDRYKSIFENSLEGIFQTTPEGRITAANAALAKMLGYDSAEEIIMSVTDVGAQVWVNPEERARLVQRLQEEGAVRGHECRFKRRDGTAFWVSLSTRPILDPDGRLAAFEGFVEDIDERKRAELALAESEQRYRMLFESAPAGIILIGTDGRVRAANSLQARLYGYDSAQQLIGFYAPLFVAEKDRERAARNMGELLEGDVLGERIYTAVRRDGSEFTVEVTSITLRDSRQKVQGYLCLTRDVTKDRLDEAERTQLRLERTHLARVLTVDEISTSLAHEINQPLGAILNNAEAVRILLSKVPAEPEALSEIVDDIIKDAMRAGEVVRKVRRVVRKSEVKFERLSVPGLVQETLEILQNSLTLNNAALRLELRPGLADVRGDRVRLQQVLLNLANNALDAMKNAPAKVLTIRSEMDGPDTVTVSVSDSGPGVAEAARTQLFEPFFTTKRAGLGLGLSICRSIIEEHGGRIWEHNNPGGGATFSFSLKAWRNGSV